jgi:hypothetical protein
MGSTVHHRPRYHDGERRGTVSGGLGYGSGHVSNPRAARAASNNEEIRGRREAWNMTSRDTK